MSQGSLSSDPVPDPVVYRRQRSYTDLYSRARVAPMYYVVGCAVLLMVGEFNIITRNVIVGATFVFLAFWWLRYKNHVPPDFADEAACTAWSRLQWGLVHTGYLLWGALAAMVAFDQAEPQTSAAQRSR